MDTSVIAPIRGEQDYRNAERTIRWDAAPGTTEADRLDVLVVLLEAYEAEHHRIEPAGPDRPHPTPQPYPMPVGRRPDRGITKDEWTPMSSANAFITS